MTRQEKIIATDNVKKKLVLEIIEKLNGESFEDCKQILDAVNFYVRGNAFFDADMARDIINAASDE